jgi:hypothetical protein
MLKNKWHKKVIKVFKGGRISLVEGKLDRSRVQGPETQNLYFLK